LLVCHILLLLMLLGTLLLVRLERPLKCQLLPTGIKAAQLTLASRSRSSSAISDKSSISVPPLRAPATLDRRLVARDRGVFIKLPAVELGVSYTLLSQDLMTYWGRAIPAGLIESKLLFLE
jgi:hypothetical protein